MKTDFGYGCLPFFRDGSKTHSPLSYGFVEDISRKRRQRPVFLPPTHTRSRILCNIGSDFCKNHPLQNVAFQTAACGPAESA
jgi:hypothetical protein